MIKMIKRILNFVCDPGNAVKRKVIFYIILVIVFASDFFVTRHHAAFFWDEIPGWSAFYGLVSSVAIIAVFKLLGHAWLLKKEDYYD